MEHGLCQCPSRRRPMVSNPDRARIKRQVRNDLFQFAVFMAEGSELAQLLEPEPGELLLPPVERLLAHAQPPAHLGDFLATLDLVQGVDDLLVAASFAWHLCAPLAGLAGPLRKSQIASFSRFRCRGFWGLGQKTFIAIRTISLLTYTH